MPSVNYLTSQGDTFDGIARKAYGPQAETLMSLIVEANPDYREVVIFSGGQLLEIPERPTKAGRSPWQ